ncbi:chemotaxis protein [Pseudomonas fluvialis]|uniref:Methyl-accepting chemotaxis protein CtpL n=1 Tax=Pseudomonas fluvialis TaxID=1793966 RepID=A0ABQ2AUI2_9PSED|nr:methyl-accepting chemotaxis protein [Pseudomonas fluvialis]OXM42291.1 chemotaxis protein [Pseudomonas fluvialis]GGH95732.1 methyl-accepting chemotaxis protein CtpL [Pseudomonas fluvialis]
MRLKSLTNLNTSLLLLVCLSLAATLWWSQRALQQPQRLMSLYLQLSQAFQQQVAGQVLAYLDSGDALRHQQAEQAARQLATRIDTLPNSLAEQLRPSLLHLQDFIANPLLAAGKLAGDPQGLLVQAERELAGNLEQLQRYASSSQHNDAARYLAPLQSSSLHLLRLAHARGRYVSQGQEQHLQAIQRELQQLQGLAEQLQGLPLLGEQATASASSSFAALLELDSSEQQQSEDRGSELKRELAYLLRRYPDELQRTSALVQQRLQLRSDTQQRIDALQQALAGLEPLVQAEQARIQQDVRTIQIGLILLILAIALLIDRMQRSLTRLLSQLVPQLSAWAQGDFSQPLQLSSRIVELQAIEQSLQRLREYLQTLVGEIRQHAGALAASSQHLAGLGEELQHSGEQQAAETASIRDALAHLQDSIGQVAGDADQAAGASHAAGTAVAEGQRVIEQSLHGLHGLVGEVRGSAQAIEQLAHESGNIGSVLSVIRGVAEQTNLLALNAAIEAARAGELGRGFAVVADEVRTLAQRTASATEEIQQLTARLQQAAQQSLGAMRQQVEQAEGTARQAQAAEGALDTVVEAIRTMADRVQRIAQASAQQHDNTAQISQHSEHIYRRGSANLQRIASSRQQSEQLRDLSEQLQHTVHRFQV